MHIRINDDVFTNHFYESVFVKIVDGVGFDKLKIRI